ncbi:MAG: HYR domain-containing protein [candidate division Zixibacteria bacterium]|nr:HYR domain-containing protein [candidate division Zixibacteria bacterium]
MKRVIMFLMAIVLIYSCASDLCAENAPGTDQSIISPLDARHPDDIYWDDYNGGFNDLVTSVIVYRDTLYAAGFFTATVYGDSVKYIAKWNNSEWLPVGLGTQSAIYALTVYNDELVAGGTFREAGEYPAERIAKWNGNTWSALAAGMNSTVYSLSVHNDTLIAGGSFTQAGYETAYFIAKWDGNIWWSIANNSLDIYTIKALGEYNGNLVAGGDSVAILEDTVWNVLVDGPGEAIYGFANWQNKLVVCGDFDFTATGILVNNIAWWDGAIWGPFGLGLRYQSADYGYVDVAVVYHDTLIAGGKYNPPPYICGWGDYNWKELGSGVEGTWRRVLDLTIFNGDLVVGGWFTVAGGDSTNHIARWRGPGGESTGACCDDATGICTDNELEADCQPLSRFEAGVLCADLNPPCGTILGACCDDYAINSICIDDEYESNCLPPSRFAPGVLCADLDPPCGTILGACCDDVTGICTDNEELADCQPPSRFEAGVLCADLNPPCGTILGACCDDATGICTDNEELADCQPPSRFEADVLCADLVPPCGTILGACCDDVTGICTDNEELADCQPPSRFEAGVLCADLDPPCGSNSPPVALCKDTTVLVGQHPYLLADNDSKRTSSNNLMSSESLSDFIAADGSFDLESARAAGYEGAIDISGFDMELNTETNQPVFSPLNSRDPGWSQLDDGVNGDVLALAVYDGDLIAGGCFTEASGVTVNYIARWDGSNWYALGSGMSDSVWSLTVYDGDLIAGGDFSTAGGNPASRIARWDGYNWHSLGSGVNRDVKTLIVYQNELIVGGSFTTAGGTAASRIARWNGSWSTLGSGANSYVRAFTIYNGMLIVGGWFTSAGGVAASRIASWNGTNWGAIGGGMNAYVRALAVYDGDLVAGGGFTNVGNHIAMWNGSSWNPLGDGVNNDVKAITIYNNNLIAAGLFTEAGGNSVKYIASWNGIGWSALGTGVNDYIRALTVYDNGLIAGGYFTASGTREELSHVARWDEALICEAYASVDDGSYDPDGDPVDIVQLPAGPYPTGQTQVILIITDDGGLADTCTGTVTVIDTIPPVVICPADTALEADTLLGGAYLVFAAEVEDDCPGAEVICDPPSGALFPIGNTEVICIGEDASGNTDTCSFLVTVVDSLYEWEFHPFYVDGILMVWGTVNCQIVGYPIFEDTVFRCNTYRGTIPIWANDLLIKFKWLSLCDNVDYLKFVAPYYDSSGHWQMEPLGEWMSENLSEPLRIPNIGDSTNTIQHVYTLINLNEWLENPQPLRNDYTVSNGRCADLPGFLVGTTPIVYDSLAGPDENPYSTTPITATLYLDAEVKIPFPSADYAYLPGDANMPNAIWPPTVIGADVTYLVNYFRAISGPCLLDNFYAAADINGDCLVIGSDVTRLVNYFRGDAEITWCPDYEPAWPTPNDLPGEAPPGWPNCE